MYKIENRAYIKSTTFVKDDFVGSIHFLDPIHVAWTLMLIYTDTQNITPILPTFKYTSST